MGDRAVPQGRPGSGRADLRQSAPGPDPRRQALARAIKRARMARNRSQKDFARAAGISVRVLGYAEAGTYVSLKTLMAIEAALGWPADKISAYLDGDDEALTALTTRPRGIPDATVTQLADLNLTIDLVSVLDAMERLRDLRTEMSDDGTFMEFVLRMTRPHPRTTPGETG